MERDRQDTTEIPKEAMSVTLVLDSPDMVAELFEFVGKVLRLGGTITMTVSGTRKGQVVPDGSQ